MPPRLTHVVDACAIIAYLKNEPGHENFADLIMDENHTLAIHPFNLSEVYLEYLRADTEEIANEAFRTITEMLRVLTEDCDEGFMQRVARWKNRYADFPWGDAFVAAAAEEHACVLVTADHKDFEEVELRREVAVHWIR